AARVTANPGRGGGPTGGAPVAWAPSHGATETIEAVIAALAPACPDRAMAGWGRRFRIAIQGRDPRTDRGFIWHMFQARPRGGASPSGDGLPGARELLSAMGVKFRCRAVTESPSLPLR